MTTKKWYTMADMAEHLGLSTTKFKGMVGSGIVPKTAYFTHERTYRFNVDLVEAALLGSVSTEQQLEFDFGTEDEEGANNEQ